MDSDLLVETACLNEKSPISGGAPTKSDQAGRAADDSCGRHPAQSGARGVLIALGSNVHGPWGGPPAALERAFGALQEAGLKIVSRSPVYATAPVGQSRKIYANAVAAIRTHRSPEAVLRTLKHVEAAAGRRASGRPWGPRTLDLDIIAYGSVVRNWRGRRPRHAAAGPKPLVLPHPLMHMRPFVLRPLLDIAPAWRHPVMRRSARELWRGVSRQRSGRIVG